MKNVLLTEIKVSVGYRKSNTGTRQDLIICVVVDPIMRFRIREWP